MTRPAQKQEEKRWLEWYLAKANIEATIIGAAEPPDFIVRMGEGGATVGIELTSYTQAHSGEGPSLRQTETAWRSFLDHVRTVRGQYPSLSGISVWLKFKDGLMPPRREYDRIVEEVAALATADVPSDAFVYRKPSSPALAMYISHVRLRKVRCYIDWTYDGTVGSVGVTDSEIANVVTAKNGKVEKGVLDALWLIVYGGVTISQMLDYIHDDMDSFTGTLKAMQDGPFDRLVLIGPDIRWWEAASGWQRIEPA